MYTAVQTSVAGQMKSIAEVLRLGLEPRVLGFDDAPFQSRPRVPGSEVHAVGIVTSGSRFEGMLYTGGLHMDGLNAGDRLASAVLESKFHEQVHAILLDGVTMGGLNVIDIEELAKQLQRPVVAVMRRRPNMEKMLDAISKVHNPQERTLRLERAGPIFEVGRWVFQYRCHPSHGVNTAAEESPCPEDVALLLNLCTPAENQKIPECLRIAHLVGSAVKTGQSSSSA